MLSLGENAAQRILTCSVKNDHQPHGAVGTCVWSVSNKKHCKPNIYVELKKLGKKDVKYLGISFF